MATILSQELRKLHRSRINGEEALRAVALRERAANLMCADAFGCIQGYNQTVGVADIRRKGTAKKFERPTREDARSPLDRASGFDVTWENVQPLFEAAKRLESPSFVYLIGEEDEGPIKIGVAKDPVKRLGGMRTGNPRHLLIEYVIVGDIRAERLLHEMWEPLGIRSKKNRNRTDTRPGTEWFAPEIRSRLFPVIADIAEAQAHLLTEGKPPEELSLIREAHELHGIEPHFRDRVLTLTQGGYHERKM